MVWDTNDNALNNLQMTGADTHNYQTFQQSTQSYFVRNNQTNTATAAAMVEDNFYPNVDVFSQGTFLIF